MTINIEVTEQEVKEVKTRLAGLVKNTVLNDLLINGSLTNMSIHAVYAYGEVKAELTITSKK